MIWMAQGDKHTVWEITVLISGESLTIRLGMEFELIVTESNSKRISRYTSDGVKRVRVDSMRLPTAGEEKPQITVENLTPVEALSPTWFDVFPDDLKAILPTQQEEAPEDGSHPAGYGPHV